MAEETATFTRSGRQVVPSKRAAGGEPSGTYAKPAKKRREEKEFDANTFLAQHHDVLQTYVLLNLRPHQIADRFHTEYGVPITQTEVSQRINNLKKNGKIKLNPVNESTCTRAEDAVYPPRRYCKFFFN